MGQTNPDRCDQCGAARVRDSDCIACFHALLAFENERPAAFEAVHHLTVATYYLQHPRAYTADALTFWRDAIRASLEESTSSDEIRRRASLRFEGTTRVREPTAVPPVWWPSEWPITVQSVLQPGEDIEVAEYVERARGWARETLDALNRAHQA
jgi:hypothetical protein